MRAEITFLSRVIFRIDKDRIVRARRHTCFTTDTDRLIEVDNTVRTLEHRRGRASRHTRSMHTLITTSDLMRSSCLWKHTYIDVFDISPGDRNGNDVFRLTRSGAGMTADAASVVYYLCPLNG